MKSWLLECIFFYPHLRKYVVSSLKLIFFPLQIFVSLYELLFCIVAICDMYFIILKPL